MILFSRNQLALSLLGWAALAAAAPGPRSSTDCPGEAGQDGAAPRLVLETPAGERSEVPLAGLNLADPRTRGAWLCRPVGVAPAAPTEAPGDEAVGLAVRVELVSGDVLLAHLLDGKGETLSVRLAGHLDLTLEIGGLRSLRFPDCIPGDRSIALVAPREGDRLDRWTGREVDPIAGAVEAFESEGVRFESEELGSRLVPWEEVAALFVEDLGGTSANPTEEVGLVPVVLDFADGSRLRGGLIGLEERGCSLRIAGTPLLVPWSELTEVTVDDGSLRYLSELDPVLEEGRGSPFGDDLGMVWDHRVDGCVTGGAMISGGVLFRRGIGVHAPSRLTFALDGEYRTLRGLCAIDDSSLRNPALARGTVIFRVLVDGEVAFESGTIRGGDAAVSFAGVDLGGHRELVLEADPAGDFRGDRANWIRPLLVR